MRRSSVHPDRKLRIGSIFGLAAAPLAIIAFWVGMATAAHAYRPSYDWPYQTISVLLYSDQNPHGYVRAWAGLELCGLAGIVWTTALRGRLERAGARPPMSGLGFLQAGFLFMCCAVLPDRLLPLSKGHEIFAILAFACLCVGVIGEMWALTAGPGYRSYPGGRGTREPSVRWLLVFLPLVPLVLAALTQLYLSVVRPDLPWVTPAWRTRGISPFLSFGFWEWVSGAVLSICLLLICVWQWGAEDRH